MNKKQLGAEGERFVSKQLQHQQFIIIEMNWRNRFGEIDIVAEKDNTLFFIEVRTRTIQSTSETPQFGHAIEAMTNAKRKKLYALAQLYCYDKKMLHRNYRILFAPVSYNAEQKHFILEHLLPI